MREKIDIALVYGCDRGLRGHDIVARWATTQVMNHPEFNLDVIDSRVLSGLRDVRGRPGVDLAALRRRIAAADAFVVVTPEYNHDFPFALKALIGLAYEQWQAKPVAFVSCGDEARGLREIEQLRLVFNELHAVTVKESVSFSSVEKHFDEQGRLRDPEAAFVAMRKMLNRVFWWATALRDARRIRSYADAQ